MEFNLVNVLSLYLACSSVILGLYSVYYNIYFEKFLKEISDHDDYYYFMSARGAAWILILFNHKNFPKEHYFEIKKRSDKSRLLIFIFMMKIFILLSMFVLRYNGVI